MTIEKTEDRITGQAKSEAGTPTDKTDPGKITPAVERLKNIQQHILERAGGEADEICAEAKTRAERIVSAGRERIETETSDDIERLKTKLAAEAGKQLAILRARHRMQLLEQKTRIIDQVFRKVADKLLFNDGYWARLRGKLEDLAGHEGTIRCRAEHAETLGKIIDELNKETNGKMPPLGEEPVSIAGGFVLEGTSFDVDESLDAELANFREKVLPELIQKAFADV